MTEPATISRFAVVLVPTQAYLDWANSCPDGHSHATLEEVQREPTVYLISEARADPERYVRRHYKALFEEELNSWYTDPGFWPKDLSYKTFRRFFTIHVSSMVFDLGSGPIIKDDGEE